MNPLEQFQLNSVMRETVKSFMIDSLKELAVERIFEKQAISGIYEARKVIDISFDKLEEMYSEKKKPLIESSR